MLGVTSLPERWFRNDDESLNWLGNASNAYYHHTRWVRPWFWRCVPAPRERTAWGSWLATVWCRATGHRGQIYYNAGGLEPDNRCKGCGEEVG